MMGLRMTAGIARFDFQSTFSREINEVIPETLAEWKHRGFVVETKEAVALNKPGLLLLNQFLVDALSELD